MGYEDFLAALGRLDRPGTWYYSWWIANQMGKERRLTSAYMTRLFKMGLVERRRAPRRGRGRPAYVYRLSRRGRQHLRWLQEGHDSEIMERFLRLLPRDGVVGGWTPDMDRLARRFLRRRQGEVDHYVWVNMLTKVRAKCLNEPWLAFDWDWWKRRDR